MENFAAFVKGLYCIEFIDYFRGNLEIKNTIMQAYLEKIPIDQSAALYIKELNMQQFDAPLHFHPEYEIMMSLKSRGIRFVGDNISDYKEGDLVFLGPNLPHYWHKSVDGIYGDEPVHAIVIQFSGDLLGQPQLDMVEFSAIKSLFERSVYGLAFSADTFTLVNGKIRSALHANGFERIMCLFEILHTLAATKDWQTLATHGYKPTLNHSDNDRIEKIYRYILDNYLGSIDLGEAASLISMSKSAFCHFFKKRTRKNFAQFVNETRIGHAAKMLIETSRNISEICYASGFNNLSNFNRRFKVIKKMSPAEYRNFYNQEHIAPKQNFIKTPAMRK